MKISIHILFVLFCFSASAQNVINSNNGNYLDKTIIIKVKPLYASLCSNSNISHSQLNTILASIGVSNLHKKFPLDKNPAEAFNSIGQAFADLSLIYEFNYTADLPIEKIIKQLLNTNILVYAEPHFVPQLSYIPNDPLANPTSQYHLQTINAFNAWNINKGDSSITIGITDTGTEYTHSDLNVATKRNYADVPDGIDNDGDGYIDNYKGWDLGMDDNDATYESNAHGIHVSGIAAASADNSNGGAGVGFNCKYLPVKISNSAGSLIAAYEGIKYAADHGCAIINCSWGGGGAAQYGQDIITYATINKNCLVVAAAGNNAVDGNFYPAAYEYVISVANTTSSDTKHSTSNYGYFIDVTAPGELINSTWTSNSYMQLTGTSMASPVVAGAAGIVKNQFPTYTGLQIGERLKVTADDIYPVNPSYTNKLGTGRINLFRALTDPPKPSIVFKNKIITDRNDEAFISGDTLFITSLFTNYLNPTTALTVTVTPLSAYATNITNTLYIGALGTLVTYTNAISPFKFKLTGVIPANQAITFEVLMQDGTYTAKQYFTLNVNVDYINITINDIKTTATSRGRIGFNQDGQIQGLGFKYLGNDLMYDAGFMIGKDSTHVSDCVRGITAGGSSDSDFFVTSRIIKQTISPFSDFDTKAKMNDNPATFPLGIDVEQNTYAWNAAPNKKFVIWEYLIKNTSTTDTIKNLFAGICADWDIDDGTFSQNRSAYDLPTKMGYSYYTGTSGKYAGIKLLTNSSAPNFYAIDNVAGGAGGIAINDGFTTKEKYIALSTQRLAAGTTGVGADVLNVMSTGPYWIEPTQTIKVAFALIAGDSLLDIVNSANSAQIKYNGVATNTSNFNSYNTDGFYIYPNPSNSSIYILQDKQEPTTLQLYSISGTELLTTKMETNPQKIDLTPYSKGIYFLKLSSHKQTLIKKIVVVD